MNMNRFVKERCRLTVPAFVLGLTLALLPSTALVAQESVYSGGLFELGDAAQPPGFAGMGDIVLLAGQPGPDWEDLFTADGSFRDDYPLDEGGNPLGNGVPDYVELYGGQWALFTADDVSLGSGFESTALDTDGRVKNGTVTGDHDIGNAYVYSTADSTGNLVLFLGFERLGSGDSHLEFEFNQEHYRLGHGGYSRGEPWEVLGSRTAGDLLVRLDFAGGALGSVALSSWDGDAWAPLEVVAGEGCNVAETLCAICNVEPVDGGPWPSFDPSAAPGEIAANHFVEAGVNVGAVLGSQLSYITVQMRTPEDVAFGYFGEGN